MLIYLHSISTLALDVGVVIFVLQRVYIRGKRPGTQPEEDQLFAT
jgi:hypothetical protein